MQTHVQIAKGLAQLLDNQFSLFGFKFGLDPLIGMIPVVGDLTGLILSSYILWIAHQADLPSHILTKMWRNVIIDFILGIIPGIGDAADFFFKANSRNIQILENELNFGQVVEAKIVH